MTADSFVTLAKISIGGPIVLLLIILIVAGIAFFVVKR